MIGYLSQNYALIRAFAAAASEVATSPFAVLPEAPKPRSVRRSGLGRPSRPERPDAPDSSTQRVFAMAPTLSDLFSDG